VTRRRKKQFGLVDKVFTDLLKVIFSILFLPFTFLNRVLMRGLFRKVLPSVAKECTTKRGERVKSNTERRIADLLYSRGINYEYEKPVRIWFLTRVRPDFYLPDYDVYIEYHGLLSHVTLGKKYKQGVEFKRKHYDRLDMNVIELNGRHRATIEKSLMKELESYLALSL